MTQIDIISGFLGAGKTTLIKKLLDEAFKGLDDQCRRDTVAYIRRHTPGASLLCVTHDPEEAALLGGRCLDLSTL